MSFSKSMDLSPQRNLIVRNLQLQSVFWVRDLSQEYLQLQSSPLQLAMTMTLVGHQTLTMNNDRSPNKN